METKIVGTVLPVLELTMQPNERVYAESGELSWMSMSIQMQTGTSVGGQQGGFLGALGRAVAGGTFFMTEYTAVGGPGLLAFAAKLPGEILPLEIAAGETYMIHRHGFLCATPGVQFSIGFQQRLGAGIFGGTGFRLQRLTGQGPAWVALNGEVVTYDLQPGNTLRVHPSQVGMFQGSVQFSIVTVPGIQNMFFGGQGLFLAALTGPGRVWLQSMSMQHLAHAIQEYLPQPRG
ncbi:MAG TPA: TIGR00266 family protein [Candidatus Dormibacteraeota bacterium]|nr:TIGR00266 family protein [Candidatus Dormibacteraeota bacterium]